MSFKDTTENKKLKILCMHGFLTNKEFMKKQTEFLRKDLEDIAQLIYVDGPFEVPHDLMTEPNVIKNLVGTPRSWIDYISSNKTRKTEDRADPYIKFKAVFQEASDYYDGALCFSQGSFAFQLMLYYHAIGYYDWPIFKNIKFFINFSADTFRISLKNLNYTRFQIPSLHFLSEQDYLFNRCITSPSFFKNPEIIFHTYGHRFPILGNTQKRQLITFMKKHGYGKAKLIQIQKQSRL